MPRITATTHSLSALIGTIQQVRLLTVPMPGDLDLTPDPRIVSVYIAGANQPYGQPRLLVQPMPGFGTGQAWINADRLIIPDSEVTQP
jgi:hypothetical protein